jgi:hypothetical protein
MKAPVVAATSQLPVPLVNDFASSSSRGGTDDLASLFESVGVEKEDRYVLEILFPSGGFSMWS